MITTNTPTERTWTTIPQSVLDSYASAVVRLYGDTEQMEGGEWFATAVGFPGVWATGDTPEAALVELESVIRDWTHLKTKDRDGDLPVVEGIDPNSFPHL